MAKIITSGAICSVRLALASALLSELSAFGSRPIFGVTVSPGAARVRSACSKSGTKAESTLG